jgi:hypothetical protein
MSLIEPRIFDPQACEYAADEGGDRSGHSSDAELMRIIRESRTKEISNPLQSVKLLTLKAR